jgi:hypothetical protein
MTNLANLAASQLNSIIAIKEQIQARRGQIELIAGADPVVSAMMRHQPQQSMP